MVHLSFLSLESFLLSSNSLRILTIQKERMRETKSVVDRINAHAKITINLYILNYKQNHKYTNKQRKYKICE